jgi:hypothetical protein
MISQVSLSIHPLREKVDSFTPLMNSLVEECKKACSDALELFKSEAKDHNENVWELKGEYEETVSRMRKERADLQMMFVQTK